MPLFKDHTAVVAGDCKLTLANQIHFQTFPFSVNFECCVLLCQVESVMREMGFPKRIVSLIEALYSEQQSAVRIDSGTTDWFSVSKCVRQGCIMSPQLLSIYKITELRYADDTALFSTTSEGFNNLVQAVNKHGAAYKLSINAAKTKIMELDKWHENTTIVIDNVNVERVQSFQYLDAMFTTKGDGAANIKQQLAMAVQALNNMQYLWKSDSKELKLKVLRTCIFQIATYGCERWVLRKLDIKRINASEMKCYRKILRIPWIAHRTNCSILNIYIIVCQSFKFQCLGLPAKT